MLKLNSLPWGITQYDFEAAIPNYFRKFKVPMEEFMFLSQFGCMY